MNWKEAWRLMEPYFTDMGLRRLKENLESGGNELAVGLTTQPDLLFPEMGNRKCECVCPVAMTGWDKENYSVYGAHAHFQLMKSDLEAEHGMNVTGAFTDWWDANGELPSARLELLKEVNRSLGNFVSC